MIEFEEVIQIHEILIEKFGGLKGIKNEAGLKSALARPFMEFDGKQLYEDTESQSAALIESLLINHPFNDGNKRTGYVLMRMLLLRNGKDIDVSENEKYQFVISIAAGEMKFEEIRTWLSKNCKTV